MADDARYDEFGLFHENASEHGIALRGSPTVERSALELPGGRMLSYLRWGAGAPRVLFVHGGAQNAHTWDTVILALLETWPGFSAVAVDLPGHGHSQWRDEADYTPENMADDLALLLDRVAPATEAVVGMSLGGMTSIQLAARHPDLVRRLMLVDITPGVTRDKAKAIFDFVNGPQTFPDFESLLARTVEHNPTRSVSSLRRGILHNAHQAGDGTWRWNYDRRHRHGRGADGEVDAVAAERNPAWEQFAQIACPLVLVRGALSPVVDDGDVAEARRLQPAIRVEVVDGAGHSVQGDRPFELAALIRGFLGEPATTWPG